MSERPAPPPKPGTTAGGPSGELEAQDDALVAAAQAAAKIAEPDTAFTGTSIDIDKQLVKVFRVGGASTLSAAGVAAYDKVAPLGASVQFVAARLSISQKNTIDRLVTKYHPDLTAAGVHLAAWGLLDGYAHPYVIEYSSGTPPTDIVTALNTYGADTITFRPGEPLAF